MAKQPTGYIPSDTKAPKDPVAYVDWLYDRLSNDPFENMKKPRVWQFTLRPKNVAQMIELAAKLEVDGYMVQTQEIVYETKIVGDKRTDKMGRPQIMLFVKGLLTPAELKAQVKKLLKIAKAHRAGYDELESMTVSDFKFLYGPPVLMPLKEAIGILRNYTSAGLRQGSTMSYRFGFKSRRPAVLIAGLTSALKTQIDKRQMRVQEAGPISPWQVEVVALGKNSDKALKEAFTTMEGVAKQVGVKLHGVTF